MRDAAIAQSDALPAQAVLLAPLQLPMASPPVALGQVALWGTHAQLAHVAHL
jgi:hypothetical protein